MKRPARRKISWFDWQQGRQSLGLARRELLGKKRVPLLTVAVTAVFMAGCWLTMPQLAPIFFLKMALVPAIVYLQLFMIFAIYAVVPAIVTVRRDVVAVSQGERHWAAKADQIIRTRIVIFSPDQRRLRIVYNGRKNQQTRSVAIPRRINLDSLAQILPVAPQVKNCRSGYARLLEFRRQANSKLA